MNRRSFLGFLGIAAAAPAVLAKAIEVKPEPEPYEQHPIEIEGGHFGAYQPDGGVYPMGRGSVYYMHPAQMKAARELGLGRLSTPSARSGGMLTPKVLRDAVRRMGGLG